MSTLTEKIDSREWTIGEKPTVTMHYVLAGVAEWTGKVLREHKDAWAVRQYRPTDIRVVTHRGDVE